MALTEFFPNHPSVLMRAGPRGLYVPSCRSHFSPSCASTWHNLSHDQDRTGYIYRVNTYANRMHCIMFLHRRGLFSIREFRECCTSGICQGEWHAKREISGVRCGAGMRLTLRFRYLLFGCPAEAVPPAVLVARLVRISSMSCSAVVCTFSAVVVLYYRRVSLQRG